MNGGEVGVRKHRSPGSSEEDEVDKLEKEDGVVLAAALHSRRGGLDVSSIGAGREG